MIGRLALARLTAYMPVCWRDTSRWTLDTGHASSLFAVGWPLGGGPERAGMGLQQLA